MNPLRIIREWFMDFAARVSFPLIDDSPGAKQQYQDYQCSTSPKALKKFIREAQTYKQLQQAEGYIESFVRFTEDERDRSHFIDLLKRCKAELYFDVAKGPEPHKWFGSREQQEWIEHLPKSYE